MDLDNIEIQRLYMGGTGTMYGIKTEDGKTYIYKPAESKGSHQSEPFRGIVQECACFIQKIVDPKSAVECRYISNSKLDGSIQELVPTSPNSRDYWSLQYEEGNPFTQEEIDQFMREFVTDYLLCNFDSHGRNFITDENGIIRGVDKEQSFRYLNDKGSEKPSITYHPNRSYGETEPIYNTIFRKYAEGKLDIDFSIISDCMDRVESYNRDDYRAIFTPYCDACEVAFGTDAQAMSDKIVARRDNMRTNIETFFQNLTEVREQNLQSRKGV